MNRLITEEEAFEALLEGREAGAPPELARMAKLAHALEVAPVMPRPAFRYGLRHRLMTEAERGTLRIHERAIAALRERNAVMKRSFRLVFAMTVGVMVMLSGSLVFAASHGALPNDSLYGVKRFREQARLAVQFDDAKRGLTLASYARNRLIEVQRMAEEGVTDERLFVSTLRTMNEQTSEAKTVLLGVFEDTREAAFLQHLRVLTTLQAEVLGSLLDRLPPAARPAARESISLANGINADAQELLRGCPCAPEESAPAPRPQGPAGSNPSAPVPTCVCQPAQRPAAGTTEERSREDRFGEGGTGGPEKPSDGSEDGNATDPNTLPDVPGEIDDGAEEIIEDILSPLPAPGVPSVPAGAPDVSVPASPDTALSGFAAAPTVAS